MTTVLTQDQAFERCVARETTPSGILIVGCKLGLWTVSGRDHAAVESNARHYWMLYFGDGEYDALLAKPI